MVEFTEDKSIEKFFEQLDISFNENVDIPTSKNKLTIVIPFMNERDEVRNTIDSIRNSVGKNVDIIVINDCSDDGYDYDKDLQRLSISYIKNRYRLGAAMSKERGVQLVQTPFFLLLDAHMRFYDSSWAANIIKELEFCPNRLLCCQSIPLEKDENGNVTKKESTANSNGAYLSYNTNKYIPEINWNYHTEHTPYIQYHNQIPCVLGAGYATSKKYWNKLKGLQGLIHYGCEEAYISIKAWREGGGCYLLPKVCIGHIYRKTFPYKIFNTQVVYNYLIISETLFPTSEKCYARNVAWKLDKETYSEVYEYLNTRIHENNRLKEYYKKFNGHNYSFIKQLNLSCEYNSHEELTAQQKQQIHNYILHATDTTKSIGLFNGLTGILLALLYYNKIKSGDEENIENTWNKISSSLSTNRDFSFISGLPGIGWMLIYSISHGLIEDNMEEELKVIDCTIEQICIKRCKDYSFLTGIGGIYCYVVARLGLSKKEGNIKCNFSYDFLEELDSESSNIISKTTDWRTRNFVEQFKERHSDAWQILPPSLNEITEISNFIPKSTKHWNIDLSSIVGAFINQIITILSIHHEL